jgi:hypothetical protein
VIPVSLFNKKALRTGMTQKPVTRGVKRAFMRAFMKALVLLQKILTEIFTTIFALFLNWRSRKIISRIKTSDTCRVS